MALLYPYPTEKPYPSSVGFGTGFTKGWAVWAHQRAINRFHHSFDDYEDRPVIPDLVEENYEWSEADAYAIKVMQTLLRLSPQTGVSGMATQKRIVQYFAGDIHWLEPSQAYRQRYRELPAKLLASISYGEAVYWLGCASWNGVEGDSDFSIDFGAFQDNVGESGLNDQGRLEHAFDVRYQVQKKWNELVAWADENGDRRGCSPPDRPATEYPERIWRRACMAHNRPLDAAVLARFPLDELDSAGSVAFEKQWVGVPGYRPSPWNEPLNWVKARGCSFPDGKRVETRLDWCRFYALARGKTGEPGYWPGLVCRFVKTWGPQA